MSNISLKIKCSECGEHFEVDVVTPRSYDPRYIDGLCPSCRGRLFGFRFFKPETGPDGKSRLVEVNA